MVSNETELGSYLLQEARKNHIYEEDIRPFITKLTRGGFNKKLHLKIINERRLKEYAGSDIIEDFAKHLREEDAEVKDASPARSNSSARSASSARGISSLAN